MFIGIVIAYTVSSVAISNLIFSYLVPDDLRERVLARFGLFRGILLLDVILDAVPVFVLQWPVWVFHKRYARDSYRYLRWKRDRCVECDFDLRAHGAGEKCPECGTEIPEKD